jgi:hypothetical protein
MAEGKLIAAAAMKAAATVQADRFIISFFNLIPPDRFIKFSMLSLKFKCLS